MPGMMSSVMPGMMMSHMSQASMQPALPPGVNNMDVVAGTTSGAVFSVYIVPRHHLLQCLSVFS